MKRMQQLSVGKGMRELSSQMLAVQVRNIKSKNILSKIRREEVMAYASDELLNEIPLQNFTASNGDTPNVEDNEINIGIAEHKVRQEEELGVENEAACVTDAVVNA